MPSQNIYSFDPDADDDILEDSPESQHSDACPACKIVKQFGEKIGLTDMQRRTAAELLHNVMESEANSPPELKGGYQSDAVFGFVESLLETDYRAQVGHSNEVVDRAIIEVLDDMTGNNVSQRIKAYRLEKHLYITHKLLAAIERSTSYLNDLLEIVEDAAPSFGKPIRIASPLMTMHKEVYMDRAVQLSNEYIAACEEAGVQPIAELINKGIYPPDQAPDYIEMLDNAIKE